MKPHVQLSIEDRSHAGEARRVATALAASIGFDEADIGRVGVAVTEAATNIVKHAGSGQLLVRAMGEPSDRPGIEVLALDKGPGMADVERCTRDGYSTAGSPGTGLGAISRLSTSLDIYSRPGGGTALLLRLLPRGVSPPRRRGAFTFGAVAVAAPGESESGDAWDFQQGERHALAMVSDGLGHGPLAARAAEASVRAFRANLKLPLEQLLEAAHRALLPTRGAAMSVADLDLDRQEVRYAGLGNVCGLIAWPGGARSMVGQNGTLGAEWRNVHLNTYPWPEDGCLVLHSDGLTSRVALHPYPGLLGRQPSLIAGVLYRDFSRGRDDATVLVACPAGDEA